MMSDLRKNIFSIKIWTVTTFCLLSLVNMNASNALAHSLQVFITIEQPKLIRNIRV